MAARPPVQDENTPALPKRAPNRFSFGLALALSLALLAPFTTYFPWRVGPWPEIEFPIIFLHFSAALCSAILMAAYRLTSRAEPAPSTTNNPVLNAIWSAPVLMSAGIGLWSIAMAPFAAFPLLSIIGAPQTADGAVSWLDISIFIVAARYCVGAAASRKVILATLITLALFLPTLSYFPETRPIWFNDYLAFLALAAAVAIPGFAAQSQSPILIKHIALGVLIAIPGVFVSNNHTIFAIFPALCFPAYLFGATLLRTSSQNSEAPDIPAPRRVKLVRSVYAVALFSIIVAIPVLISVFSASDSMKSLQSRDRMLHVLSAPLWETPSVWVTGRGWGHTQRDFSERLSQANTKIWDGGWDAPQRDIFHSHNSFFETILSAGVPAVAGLIALLATLIILASPGSLALAGAFALGYSALSAFWFQLSLTLPITAVAFATFATPLKWAPSQRWFPIVVMGILGVACIGQLYASAKLSAFLVHANIAERGVDQNARITTSNYSACRDFPDDSWRGEVVIAHQVARYARRFRLLSAKERPDSDALKKLSYFYCLSEFRGLEARSLSLLRTALISQASFRFQNQFAQLRGEYPFNGEKWTEIANTYLGLAPKRTDPLLPYMAHLLEKKDYGALDSTVEKILRNNEEDPVGLWFSGISYVIKGGALNRKRGIDALQRSIDAGIETWTPIPQPIRALLSSNK